MKSKFFNNAQNNLKMMSSVKVMLEAFNEVLQFIQVHPVSDREFDNHIYYLELVNLIQENTKDINL